MDLFKWVHNKCVYNRRMSVLSNRISAMLNCVPDDSLVLDLGCGDGKIDSYIMNEKKLEIQGIDVLKREKTYIPVQTFDGIHIPFENNTFDVVIIIDVLHHTTAIKELIQEAARVSKKYIIIKDHFANNSFDHAILKFMDYVGNNHYNVRLTYNYLSNAEWESIFSSLQLKTKDNINKIGLYGWPMSMIFERKLHFLKLLEL